MSREPNDPPRRERNGRRSKSNIGIAHPSPDLYCLEAELCTLGGLILDNSGWPDVSAIVQQADFHEEKNRIIFGAIQDLATAGQPFDVITLIDRLERTGQLAEAGGATWLGQAARDTPSTANIRVYAKIVKRKSLERERAAAIEKGDHHQAADLTAAIDRLEATSPGKSRFLNIAELCSTPPAEHWLIKGYVPTDSLNLVFGDPENGKSFLLIDMACHVATGRQWRGQAVKQGLVLYVAGEGRNGLAKRFRAWFEHYDEEPRNIILSSTPMQLTDPASMGALVEEIKALPERPVLILIDTINRNYGQGDENSTNDMTLAVAGLDALRIATGAAILCSHHCGLADKGRGRGSSVLRASLDCEFAIERFSRTVQIRCTKAKDFDHPAPLAWTFKQQSLPWADEEGMPINSAVLLPADTINRQTSAPMGEYDRLAYDILKEQGGSMLVGDWRKALQEAIRKEKPDIAYNTLKQAWRRTHGALIKRGLVLENDKTVSLVQGVHEGVQDAEFGRSHGVQGVHDGYMYPNVPGTEGVHRVQQPIGCTQCTHVPPTETGMKQELCLRCEGTGRLVVGGKSAYCMRCLGRGIVDLLPGREQSINDSYFGMISYVERKAGAKDVPHDNPDLGDDMGTEKGTCTSCTPNVPDSATPPNQTDDTGYLDSLVAAAPADNVDDGFVDIDDLEVSS